MKDKSLDERRYLARGGFDGMPNQNTKIKKVEYKIKHWNTESMFQMKVPFMSVYAADKKSQINFERVCNQFFGMQMKFKNFKFNDCLEFDIVFKTRADMIDFLQKCYKADIVKILLRLYYKNGAVDILKAAMNEVI